MSGRSAGCLHQQPGSTISVLQDQLASKYSLLLVATVHGKVVGCALCWILADEVQILVVGVHPEHRRQGYAAQLVRDTLTRGVSAGAEQAVLEVSSSNCAAISLYKQAGFEQMYVRKDYYSNGDDALVMCNQLSSRCN